MTRKSSMATAKHIPKSKHGGHAGAARNSGSKMSKADTQKLFERISDRFSEGVTGALRAHAVAGSSVFVKIDKSPRSVAASTLVRARPKR